MDMRMVGKLLTEYVSGLVILNEEEEIVWASDLIKKICNQKKLDGSKFDQIFSFDLIEIMNTSKVMKTPYDNKYSIHARKLIGKSEKYTFVFFENIVDFKNDRTRLYCLEKIIESINDGIIISDYEGRVVLYNNAQEKLEELSGQEIVGKYLWEAYNYKATEMSEHRKVYKTGTPIINKYKAHAYKDGIPKYLSYSTYPIVKDNEIIAVYSISKNETKLQSLLSETIELKRKLYSKTTEKNEKSLNNGTSYSFSDIVGNSSAMKNLIKEAQTIALLDTALLIVGETGTGKEVFAQSIHNFGKNGEEPFVAINCAAIPENLLESILFGTAKGSYTGAVDKVGLFEEAGAGTLFLDELNSMPISMQSKLLRVLQEKKVRPIGGLHTIPIRCRVISAINEDPQKLIREGKLRQDLFYRIAALCLYISPLRQRKEDILCMAEFFVNKYNKLLNKKIKAFSHELKETMLSYAWPGNTRELEHVIENLMVRVEDHQIELNLKDMPGYIKEVILGDTAIQDIKQNDISLPTILREIEKKVILENLNIYQWNLSETSKKLGIIRQSLKYRMKKLGIEKPENV
ncbi:sigma 54-interacting transcriptional regulator [Clostridiaceae bacterium 35-E11]